MIDPVDLQVLAGALHAICEEMGAVLIRSAHSANIRGRELGAELQLEVHVGMIVEVMLEVPEVAADRRVRARPHEHGPT